MLRGWTAARPRRGRAKRAYLLSARHGKRICHLKGWGIRLSRRLERRPATVWRRASPVRVHWHVSVTPLRPARIPGRHVRRESTRHTTTCRRHLPGSRPGPDRGGEGGEGDAHHDVTVTLPSDTWPTWPGPADRPLTSPPARARGSHCAGVDGQRSRRKEANARCLRATKSNLFRGSNGPQALCYE